MSRILQSVAIFTDFKDFYKVWRTKSNRPFFRQKRRRPYTCGRREDTFDCEDTCYLFLKNVRIAPYYKEFTRSQPLPGVRLVGAGSAKTG